MYVKYTNALRVQLSVGMYHASMTKNTKALEFAQDSSLKVLTATVAFGMVIYNISIIHKRIIHYTLVI